MVLEFVKFEERDLGVLRALHQFGKLKSLSIRIKTLMHFNQDLKIWNMEPLPDTIALERLTIAFGCDSCFGEIFNDLFLLVLSRIKQLAIGHTATTDLCKSTSWIKYSSATELESLYLSTGPIYTEESLQNFQTTLLQLGFPILEFCIRSNNTRLLNQLSKAMPNLQSLVVELADCNLSECYFDLDIAAFQKLESFTTVTTQLPLIEDLKKFIEFTKRHGNVAFMIHLSDVDVVDTPIWTESEIICEKTQNVTICSRKRKPKGPTKPLIRYLNKRHYIVT